MADEKTGLWYRCRNFVTKQSAGEWSDKVIADDTDSLVKFVMTEIALVANMAKSDAEVR